MTSYEADKEAGARRDFLLLSTSAVATVGTASALWPFIDSMNPATDVAALSTTEVDIAPIEIGQRLTVIWRGKPVFIVHRSDAEIRQAITDDSFALPDPQKDGARTQQSEWLVVVGVCTHLGCIPLGQKPNDPKGDHGGWFCPCHGSHYDTSGRIRRGPAPKNLEIPPYQFTDKGTLLIG